MDSIHIYSLLHSKVRFPLNCHIATQLAFIIKKDIPLHSKIRLKEVDLPVKHFIDDKLRDSLCQYLYKPLVNVCIEYLDQIYIVDLDSKWINLVKNWDRPTVLTVLINDKEVSDSIEYFTNALYVSGKYYNDLFKNRKAEDTTPEVSFISPFTGHNNLGTIDITNKTFDEKNSYIVWDEKIDYFSITGIFKYQVDPYFDTTKMDMLEILTGQRNKYYIGFVPAPITITTKLDLSLNNNSKIIVNIVSDHHIIKTTFDKDITTKSVYTKLIDYFKDKQFTLYNQSSRFGKGLSNWSIPCSNERLYDVLEHIVHDGNFDYGSNLIKKKRKSMRP